MLNYKEIIEKLTLEEKVSLLTDGKYLSRERAAELGVPYLYIVTAQEIGAELSSEVKFPSLYAIANTWDPTNIAHTAIRMAEEAKQLGANAMVIPSVTPRSNLYSMGITEDPLLAGRFGVVYAATVEREGLTPVVSNCCLDALDVEYADVNVNERALREYYFKPITTVAEKCPNSAFMTSFSKLKGEYENVNTTGATDKILRRGALKKTFTFCEDAKDEMAIASLNAGYSLCLNGDTQLLLDAVKNYRKLKAAIDSGLSAPDELDKACLDGMAVSEETVDLAVGEVLRFAMKCQKYQFEKLGGFPITRKETQKAHKEETEETVSFQEENVIAAAAETEAAEEPIHPFLDPARNSVDSQMPAKNDTSGVRAFAHTHNVEDKSKLSLNLALKSAVLLKNNTNALPIRHEEKVAIVGPLANGVGIEESFLNKLITSEQLPFQFVGYTDGYDLARDRSDELLSDTMQIIGRADTVLVFLGLDERREERVTETRSTKLPANQVALLECLQKLNKKVVAVLTGSGRVDVGFDKYCSALLYAPYSGVCWAEGLTLLLTGKVSPSGRLPFSMYDNADKQFLEWKQYKNSGRNKVGTFVGYRRYDSEYTKVRYPFGYGLSYTKFAYSELLVFEHSVQFVVRNVGLKDADEVVQVYVGKRDSKRAMPLKQLYGYERIHLRAGESKRITITLRHEDLQIYDEESQSWIMEGGDYQVYVGRSVSDIRLKGSFRTIGKALQKQEKLSDYLQTKSNIVSGGYYMDAVSKSEVSKKLKMQTIIFSIIAVVFDLFLGIWDQLGRIGFCDRPFEGGLFLLSIVLTVSTNGLMVGFICALIAAHVQNKNIISIQAKHLIEKAENNTEPVFEPRAYETLFFEEFQEEETRLMEEEIEEKAERDIHEYFDDTITWKNACDGLVSFAASKGVAVDFATARAVLSAMSVSRLTVLKAKNQILLSKFVSIVGEYLSASVYTDCVDETYVDGDSMLFARMDDGSFAKKNVIHAIEAAELDKGYMKLVYLENVQGKNISRYFTQFMRYVISPVKALVITPKDKNVSENSYELSPNLWFVMGLAENERVDDLPAFISEAGTVLSLDLQETEMVLGVAETHGISYYQFEKLGDDAKRKYEIREEKWKRLDKLEHYVKVRYPEFGYSNKTWLKMERYVAVFLSAGGDLESAIDSMVAVKLLPAILPILAKNKQEGDDKFVHVLESVFGEENIETCRKVLEESNVDLTV